MTALTVGSLFSGVGGMDLGLERAGASVAWQVEIDERCSSVLTRHWPDVPRYPDVREVTGDRLGPVDVVVGGFPCQDLSVAGRRAGLDGERSGLWWEFHRVLAELAPAWCVVENVPGLLSAVCPDDDGQPVQGGSCPGGCMVTHGGAFGLLLGGMADLGYGFAWRVLDARHFGLAQRRRRLFVVGRAGADGAGAAEVLLEPESGPWRAETRREAQADVAGTLGAGTPGGSWADDLDRAGAFIPETAYALKAEHRGISGDGHQQALVAYGLSTQGQNGSGVWSKELAPSVTGSHGDGMVALALNASGGRLDGTAETSVSAVQANQRGEARTGDVAGALESSPSGKQLNRVGVRRLMPVERERLQGFPDDWTRWGHDGTEMAATTREAMTGNAVAVPVAEWIGRRIAVVASLSGAADTGRTGP